MCLVTLLLWLYSFTLLSDKAVHVFGVWPLGRVHWVDLL